MKIERKGKAKLNPKMAVNSANQSAARFRRQSTVEDPSPLEGRSGREDGVPSGGSVPRGEHLDDAIRGDRQAVDHRLRIAFAQRVLDGVGDRGGHRYRPTLASALEAFGIRIGRSVHMDQVGSDHLSGADDRVIEKAGASEIAIRLIYGGLVERIAESVCVAAVHLAFDEPRVDGLAGVVNDHVAHDVDMAGFRVD